MWPALIAAGATLAAAKMGADSAEENAERNVAMQREFAQQGIQWKVADAKAAGVHPLFALGAATSSFSPVHSQVPQIISDAGQNISRAVMSQQSEATIKHLEAQTMAAQASAAKDFALAQATSSEAARRDQLMGLAIGGTPLDVEQRAVSYPVSIPASIRSVDLPSIGSSTRERVATGRSGAVNDLGAHGWQYDPSKVGTAREFDPSVAAGPPRPFLEEYRVGSREYNPAEGEHGADRGLYIVLPAGGNAAEAAEAIAEGGGTSPVAAMIYAINVQRYGEDYVRELGAMLRRSDARILKQWEKTKGWLGGGSNSDAVRRYSLGR